MLRSNARRSFLVRSSTHWRCSSSFAVKHDPLKILFCGADEFSIASLRALSALRHDRPDKIASIDVVCRPDKRVGRGLKQIREVPIKGAARELELPLHQIDTFKDWSPPQSINLVVAVSFGLLVPARILSAAKYGGLNVHPSLLPDLRGPAPILHTLLKRRQYTGVTLQTMHPTRFDRGAILAQTTRPGIAATGDCRPEALLEVLKVHGAKMLRGGIESGVFVSPLKPLEPSKADGGLSEYAPKITQDDRRIDWSKWTADDVLLRDRVIGRLWDEKVYSHCFPDRAPKRVTYHGPWERYEGDEYADTPGEPCILDEDEQSAALAIATCGGDLVSPTAVTIEGEGKAKGLHSLLAELRGGGSVI